MKKSIKLEEYLFEKFEVHLGKFPGTDGAVSVDYGEGNRTIFFNKTRRNRAALRWVVKIYPRKKEKGLDFTVSASIVGIFEIPAGADEAVVEKLLEKQGPQMLYEKVRAHAKAILDHSMYTNPSLPSTIFTKRKVKKRHREKK